MLLENTSHYWARQASLDELHDVAIKIENWDEEQADMLDAVYIDRAARLIERTRAESKQDALELADHLERVAHDSQREALDALERPYFARWRLLVEMLHRAADRLQVPETVLARKHVMELLRRIAAGPGRQARQAALTGIIHNAGQLSATLSLLQTWDLIEEVPAPGKSKIWTLTDLGRLALGLPAHAAETGVTDDAEVVAPARRFIEFMSSPLPAGSA